MAKDKLTVFQKLKQLISHGVERLMASEASHDDIRDKLWTFVNTLDRQPEYIGYLKEVYDGYFVYEICRYDNVNKSTIATRLYKRSYTATSEGVVEVADDAIEVTEKTEYVPVVTTANSTINQESVVKDQLIKDLIACDRTPFKEEHRAMLTGLSECDLKLLQADNFKSAAAPTATPAPAPSPVVVNVAEPPKRETVEEYLSHAPTEVAETIKRNMVHVAAAKDAVIKKIIANQGCPFSEDELKLKDFGELQKIAKLAGVKFDVTADYSGQAGSPTANEESRVPVMPSTAPKLRA